ncbi:MAG: hypothetical protein IKI17_06190 [Oscillospiraceae bacterium]|nr:hypothetical protein [Oscillospiraceae bacterium]
MSTIEIVSKIEALREWESLAAEAVAEVESLRDAIKAEMTARGVEEMEAGQYIARYTTVICNRFDSTAFKKALPDVYKAYTKAVTIFDAWEGSENEQDRRRLSVQFYAGKIAEEIMKGGQDNAISTKENK